MRPVINYLAVLASAVAQFVIGAIWYSPALFARKWMSLVGVTEEMAHQMNGVLMAQIYGAAFAAFLLTYYVMAYFASLTNAKSPKDGLSLGFWLWLGFVATSLFVTNNFAVKPFSLWLIDGSYWLVSMVVGGIILSAWNKKPAESTAT